MDIEKSFGTAVRKWRENLRLSQEQLAKRAGLHRTYICDVERGARNVSLKNVQKLTDALAIPLVTLFADLSPKPVNLALRADEMVDILLVEDSADDATLVVENFKRWNVCNRFYVVRDGLSALNFLFGAGEFAHRIPTDQPQIILMDLNMPKMDGLELLRRIRADSRTRSIPVVILTGSKNERDMAECKRLGVEDYILKPVNFQSFSEVSLRLNMQWALLQPLAPSIP
jgi:CheY-like chemotaxis protein/DNA-binding XRE family transcriptional regulator